MPILRRDAGLLLIVLWCTACQKNPADEGPDTNNNYVRLQNQTEHSGIMVRLVELNKFVTTDSTGFFSFDRISDGNYTLQARYPYFASEEKGVIVKDGKIQGRVSLELKQLLQFWIEPPETTISMSNTSYSHEDWFSLDGLHQCRVNISDAPVTLGTVYDKSKGGRCHDEQSETSYFIGPKRSLFY